MTTHTEPAEIDVNRWAERDTDAGTKPYPPLRKEADPEFQYPEDDDETV